MTPLRLASGNPGRTPVTSYVALVLLLVSTDSTRGVHACDCNVPSPQEGMAQADAVFSGRVVAAVEEDTTVHAFIDVLEIWKGDFPDNALVRVDTADNEAACGFPFRVDEEYVIFAARRSEVLETNICTPTGTLSRAEAKDVLGLPVSFHRLNVQFRRGDVNGDGQIDITDPIASLIYQFQGGFDPPCLETLDYENDGGVEITDAIANLTFQFLGGPPPAEPYFECGKDRDLEPLDCERYLYCPPETDTHEIVRVERIGDEVEIELFSTRPFPFRALPAILCVGTQGFLRSRFPDDGSPNTLIFTLTPEEFEDLQDTSLVTVQHGDRCFLDLDQQWLYWSLWVFGPLELPQ